MSLAVSAQSTDAAKEAAYANVLASRSDKIVATLGIGDSAAYKAVKQIIVGQYRALNTIHDTHKAALKNTKETFQADKEQLDTHLKQLDETLSQQLSQQHTNYLNQLSARLSPAQIEQVKDGMTYGVLPITYKGYQDMLPDLTDTQKSQILAWLTEARERAMDAESSEKKHAWFGKYKGKINNYLSAAGIDMKKAGQEWEARIKASEAAKKHE
ncbi:DUF3826 domain-containing protein [Arsenicibacter rosenii]|uniref:DUF3826 domain-containing protein n=1 Tax=Arsenicibacter rosenii TaxID=1750698 RepID=UPI001E598498|nr:DUF3826 domain-containing protein [Arsenicibacter rosenii]